jgi:hypothetical protein
MPFRPFKLLNASERAALADLAGAALADWRQAWLEQPSPVAGVACGPAAERGDLSRQTGWRSFATDRGTVHVADGDGALGLVRSAVAGGAAAAIPGDDSIAAALLQAGLRDLVGRLAGAAAGDAEAAPPARLWLRGSGAAWVSLPLPGGEVVALLDSGVVTELLAPLPRPVARAGALTNPQLCIGSKPVEVRVWLGSTDIDLATFQTLVINDVLLLDSRIDHPLRVTIAGRDAAPRAVLGSAEQRKAIRLTTFGPTH